MVIDSALTVYSFEDAVPESVNGIVMSCSDKFAAVAVSVTETLVFSTIVAADNSNVTTSGASLSLIVTVTAASEFVAFTAVPAVTIIVSFASSVVSSVAVNVIVPVVSPATILSCGNN